LKVLSPLRDVQVQIASIAELANDYPDLLNLQKKLVDRESSLMQGLRKKVAKNHSRLQQKFSRTLADSRNLPRMFTATEMTTAVAGAIDKTYEHVIEMKRAVTGRDTAAIHQLRVELKKLRYAIETAKPMLEETPKQQMDGIREMQALMGSIQDSDVLFETIRRWGSKQTKSVRNSLVPVYEVMSRRRRDSINAFMTRIDELHTFWKPRVLEKERSPAPLRLMQVGSVNE